MFKDKATCENDEFFLARRTHFVQDVYLLLHTKSTYTIIYYIPFGSLWSKEKNGRCQMFIRCFCSIIQVFEAQVLVNMMSFARASRRILLKMFIYAHTQKTHTLYIPFDSLWSNKENMGCYTEKNSIVKITNSIVKFTFWNSEVGPKMIYSKFSYNVY